MTDKKYVEFLLHNEEHLTTLRQLHKEHDEAEKKLLGLGELSSHEADTLTRKRYKTIREAKQLLEAHYYYDPEIDGTGAVGKAWESLMEWKYSASITKLINAIEKERVNRHKRLRQHPNMWRKLEELGLDKRYKKSPHQLKLINQWGY